MEHDARTPHWIGSLVSAFVGWLSFCLLMVMSTAFSDSRADQLGYVAVYAIILGIATFFVWLFVLLPVYVLTPARSPLWRWWVCTACGVAAGTLIGCAIFAVFTKGKALTQPLLVVGFSFFYGGIIGGVTCLFGSLTVPWFHRLGPSQPCAALVFITHCWTMSCLWFHHQASRGKTWFLDLTG